MDVVALVSGGKDSCYSILKCKQHGHNVIALAHVMPPASEPEPDSHMYQSVASSAIPALAEALGLPLYTVRTSARAVTRTLSYTPTPTDEVEDLVTLLNHVREAHPGLRAVCAGALWSDYQRLRVESAASRVGLLSLAYLWRREQSGLLDEMILAGVQAVLVKVAGIGLREEHLGKGLAEMRPTLRKLARQYGSHICGEGGEFETFVTWMPGFRRRIVLDKVKTVLHSPDPVAPVAYLKVLECHLEPMLEEQEQWPQMKPLTIPPPFSKSDADEDLPPVDHTTAFPKSQLTMAIEETSVGKSDTFLHVSVRSPASGQVGVAAASKRLESILQSLKETLASVVYVQLYLRSVSGEQYVSANRGYSAVFGIPECTPPPSRSCVGISAGNNPTVLEALVRRNRNREESDSLTLHVQSLSEWAPPCIGPYAQFVEEDGIVHVSGVLPLYAPQASIPRHLTARRQVVACAHNLNRTLEAGRACVERLGVFIVYVVAPEFVKEVREEMINSLEHQRSVTLVLPVSELPKGGLVEIRAVGTVERQDLVKTEPDPKTIALLAPHGLCCETVICGKLRFAVVTLKESGTDARLKTIPELLQIATQTISSEAAQSPLSLQVYVHESENADLDYMFKRTFNECAVSVFRSPWMPNCATFTSLVTFAS